MTCSSLASLLAAPAHDEAVRLLVLLARGVAERRHAPRGDGMAARRGGALAAPVRVVDWVHRRAACLRPLALVAAAACLADVDVLVLRVADRADARAAVDRHQPHLARGEPERGPGALLRHELDLRARRAAHLTAAARRELDGVHHRAGRDPAE